MPQKLIRLTSKPQNITTEGVISQTSQSECVFSGLFDEDLLIKKNSEIALQSLSVERKSQEIRIKKSNNTIKFASIQLPAPAVEGSNQESEITPLDTYNKTNDQELLDNITNAANRVCSMLDLSQTMNIQHKVHTDDNGNVRIEARVSPFYTLDHGFDPDPTVTNPTFPAFADSKGITGQAPQVGPANGATGIFREDDTTANPVIPSESVLFGIQPFIKSTGSLRVRFNRLNANGGQVSAYIGLVKGVAGLDKLNNDLLTEDDMEYAIRINGHNNAMDYKSYAAGPWTPTVTPINHTVGGSAYNDVLEIVLANGKFQGQIHQNNAVGGTGTDIKTVLNTAQVQDGENYFWFISFAEGKDNIVLDLCNVSVDPFDAQELGLGKFLDSTDPANQALYPTTAAEHSVLSTIIKYDYRQELTPVFRLSEDLANFLGFPSSSLSLPSTGKPKEIKNPYIHPKFEAFDGNTNSEYELTLGYFWTAPEPFDNNYEADNYIIDTQTFVLDSFDSYGKSNEQRQALSGGSRRNILATIPISEVDIPGTANGVIQYEPNNLNYIRINNRTDMVTRQLRFRFLTGRYQNVPIQNMAAMTILIKDPEPQHMDA